MKFVLAFLLVAAVNASAESCEALASRRAQVVANLVKLGLEKDALQVEDVAAFIANREWYNPFDSKLEALSFRNGFNRVALSLTQDEQVSVRKFLAQHLRALEEKRSVVAAASAETAEVFAPKLMTQILARGYDYEAQEFSMSTLQGRPVFMVRMKKSGTMSNGHALLLDPFHDKDKKRVVPMKGFTGQLDPKENTQFFVKDGAPYAMSFQENAFFDLLKGKIVDKLFDLFDHDYPSRYHGSVVFNHEGENKILTTFDHTAEEKVRWAHRGQLLLLNLDRPQEKPKVIDKAVLAASHGSQVDYVDGKTYVSFSAPGHVFVYDVDEHKLHKPFATLSSIGERQRNYVYKDGGHTYLVYSDYENSADRKSVVRVVDLATRDIKTVRPYFDSCPEMAFIKLRGVPHVYFTTENVIALVNLRTKRVQFMPADFHGKLDTFTWKGRTFLAWANHTGAFKLFDLETLHEEMSVTNMPRQINQIFTFEYQGQIYLFASVFKEMPYLFQVTRRDSPSLEH